MAGPVSKGPVRALFDRMNSNNEGASKDVVTRTEISKALEAAGVSAVARGYIVDSMLKTMAGEGAESVTWDQFAAGSHALLPTAAKQKDPTATVEKGEPGYYLPAEKGLPLIAAQVSKVAGFGAPETSLDENALKQTLRAWMDETKKVAWPLRGTAADQGAKVLRAVFDVDDNGSVTGAEFKRMTDDIQAHVSAAALAARTAGKR